MSPRPRIPGAAFRFLETDVRGLAAAMDVGAVTARELAAAHLARIRALDRRGPAIGSVIELNPDALAIAAELDRERAAGAARGPLHGIPVLLKDNIATGDRMATTAGSLALDGVSTTRDAHLVTRLRAAGTVILGKTNLSEWANIRSTRSTSGWSGRGGLTRNPYALDRNTSGSSSGSAAAIAAGFATIAIGTETDGSIVSPSSINGLVGLKPTVGLVSRDGVIPISHTQDTPGPMTRTVADAALVLDAIAGPDRHDPATAGSRRRGFARRLGPRALRGARLGVARSHFGVHPGVDAVIEDALVALAACGATLVDPAPLRRSEDWGEHELEVLLYELKAGLPAWLAEFAPHAPVATLADVIAFNRSHEAAEMPWFAQELFEMAESRGDLGDKPYRDALASCGRLAREEGLDAALDAGELDALVAPTGGLAWLTDPVGGDHHAGSFSSAAAVAGYPHLTVPAGFVHGLPVGLSFVGRAFSDAQLLGYGHAFELATRARRPPTFAATAPLR